MTLVERDPEFRALLVALHEDDNFGAADGMIHYANVAPETFLVTAQHCRALVLALELWAAHFGQKHPALTVDERIRGANRKVWRHATQAEGTLDTLLLLTQSPGEAEFADDVRSLRPRLFAIAREHRKSYRRQAQMVWHENNL